ncbi:MAG: hypothetical protein E6I73_08260 [Chloroflexi bacterium]|nr:MAG: hypothetical protein E6I73_08260 [Chloroflexota bacterium]
MATGHPPASLRGFFAEPSIRRPRLDLRFEKDGGGANFRKANQLTVVASPIHLPRDRHGR